MDRYIFYETQISDVRIDIHFHEGTTLSPLLICALLNNTAEQIIFFTTAQNISFLTHLKLPRNIFFEDIGMSFIKIEKKIKNILVAYFKTRKIIEGGNNGKSLPFNNSVRRKRLSNREIMILKLLIKGMTMYQISARLNTNYKTIATHKKNIKNKLGIFCDAGICMNGPGILFALESHLM